MPFEWQMPKIPLSAISSAKSQPYYQQHRFLANKNKDVPCLHNTFLVTVDKNM